MRVIISTDGLGDISVRPGVLVVRASTKTKTQSQVFDEVRKDVFTDSGLSYVIERLSSRDKVSSYHLSQYFDITGDRELFTNFIAKYCSVHNGDVLVCGGISNSVRDGNSQKIRMGHFNCELPLKSRVVGNGAICDFLLDVGRTKLVRIALLADVNLLSAARIRSWFEGVRSTIPNGHRDNYILIFILATDKIIFSSCSWFGSLLRRIDNVNFHVHHTYVGLKYLVGVMSSEDPRTWDSNDGNTVIRSMGSVAYPRVEVLIPSLCPHFMIPFSTRISSNEILGFGFSREDVDTRCCLLTVRFKNSSFAASASTLLYVLYGIYSVLTESEIKSTSNPCVKGTFFTKEYFVKVYASPKIVSDSSDFYPFLAEFYKSLKTYTRYFCFLTKFSRDELKKERVFRVSPDHGMLKNTDFLIYLKTLPYVIFSDVPGLVSYATVSSSDENKAVAVVERVEPEVADHGESEGSHSEVG